MNGETSFGLPTRKKNYEKFIDKYVVLFVPQNEFTGRLDRIEDGWAILKPYQGMSYDSERGLIQHIVDEEMQVRLDIIHACKPFSKEAIEALCERKNQEIGKKNGLDSK